MPWPFLINLALRNLGSRDVRENQEQGKLSLGREGELLSKIHTQGDGAVWDALMNAGGAG